MRDAAANVEGYLGRFPIERAAVFVIVGPGSAVGHATALGNGGASILARAGVDAPREAFADDWIMTHEIVHLAMPGLHARHNWMEEGLATYLEPLARARRGVISARDVWAEWYVDMRQGLPDSGDGGLDGTESWGRTYWGGAIFWLLAELEIERAALTKEKDRASSERLEKLEKEMAEIREDASALRARWQAEKEVIEEIKDRKVAIDAARTQAQKKERDGELEKVAELRYSTIPKLEAEVTSFQTKLRELQGDRALLREEVGEEDIAAVVAKWTGIPVSRLVEGERQKLVRMEEVIGQRVVGQAEAIEAVANAVRRSRAGLGDPRRPMGSFLFLGPTGVGKTEVARALAEFLFNDEQAMVRIDMGEFQEKHSVARLIGAPPGYV
ncbi:MAG TPA: AAA family ATPase, partial [Planctomycetota bacterium]|nr:AAA family ATPase [Planctomycetota bacterium]